MVVALAIYILQGLLILTVSNKSCFSAWGTSSSASRHDASRFATSSKTKTHSGGGFLGTLQRMEGLWWFYGFYHISLFILVLPSLLELVMQWAWFRREQKREAASSMSDTPRSDNTRERRLTRERPVSLGRHLRGSLGKQRTRESDLTEAARGIFGEEYSMGGNEHQGPVSSSFSSGEGGTSIQGRGSKPPYTTTTITQRDHNANGPTLDGAHSNWVSGAQDSGMISPKTTSEEHLEHRNIGLALTTAVEDAAAAAGAEAGFRAAMEDGQAHREEVRPIIYELEASPCDSKGREKDDALQYLKIRQPLTKSQRVTNDSVGAVAKKSSIHSTNATNVETDPPTSTWHGAQDEADAPPHPSPALPKPSTFPFRQEAEENTSQRSLPLSVENSIRLVEAEGEGRVLEKLENWG